MEEMFRWLFILFTAGLWLSLQEAQCESGTGQNSNTDGRIMCCNTNSGEICFTPCLFNDTHLARASTYKDCGEDCEDSEDSEDPEPLPKCDMSQDCCFHKYPVIGSLTRHFGDVSTSGSADNQHVCISLESKVTKKVEKVKWCCNCVRNCCTICDKDNREASKETAATTTNTATPGIATTATYHSSIAANGNITSTSPSTQRPSNDSPPAASKETAATTTNTATPGIAITATYHSSIAANGNITSTSSSTQRPSNDSPQAGQLSSSNTKTILVVLLLLVSVVIIIAAVVLFTRKRKLDKRTEWSPTTYTTQGETVSNVYAGVFPDNRPSEGTAPAGNHIYDELDMITQDPTPSNVYSEVQSTSVAVDMGRSVDYVDIDLPMKNQQKPMSTSKAALSLSPVYSQPFEPSASNTEYAEPFKPDTMSTATAPVLNHSSAAGDQQNDVYSLAKAIPLSDANVIYSQPNKPTKPSETTGEVGGATDPIRSEAIEVKPGVGSGGVATQDPNAVYAEPMKLKKSS